MESLAPRPTLPAPLQLGWPDWADEFDDASEEREESLEGGSEESLEGGSEIDCETIVQLHGLITRTELNGAIGITTGPPRADGRYPVQLDYEERGIWVLPSNLVIVGDDDDDYYSFSLDEDSGFDDSGSEDSSDVPPAKSPRHGTNPVPPKPPPESPPPSPSTSTARSTAAHSTYATRMASLLGLLPRRWLGADGRTTWRFSDTPECSCPWRAHMNLPPSTTVDTAFHSQAEATEHHQLGQRAQHDGLEGPMEPEMPPTKPPLLATLTSTPPRTVTHLQHIPLSVASDISRRLFADVPLPSSTLLPLSIADATVARTQPRAAVLELAASRQHAVTRHPPTWSHTETSHGHVKEAARKAASIQAQHEHQCRLAEAERARVAEESRRKAMVQKAHQLGTGQPLRLPGSARDRTQAQEAKHARRRVKEDRRKARRAHVAAAVPPALAATGALAAAEAVPHQRMPGESGLAYRRPSRGEEPDWPGQPEGARASAREPLGTLWW